MWDPGQGNRFCGQSRERPRPELLPDDRERGKRAIGGGMSENVRKCLGFDDEFFFSLGEFGPPGKKAREIGSKIRCIYIQVQKV